MLTKTQLRIMQLFVSKITKRFSLREVGRELSMHQALAYRASKELIQRKLIIPDDYRKTILNSGMRYLSYTGDDSKHISNLPFHHKDPFG